MLSPALEKIKIHLPVLRKKQTALSVSGSVILAFGLFNVHSVSGITEGGVLGLTLLCEHWLHISPAVTNFVLNVVCYFFGWKTLGKNFLAYSAVSTVSFSAAYAVFERIGLLFPEIADKPLLASAVGAVFVGVGAGLCVRAGGAVGGDDAFAMSLACRTKADIRWFYLLSDVSVLGLSLTYIPPRRILYSLLTVILSGQIIGGIQKIPSKTETNKSCP